MTDGLFEDFLANRLKLNLFESLENFNQVIAQMGNNDPLGVIRIINAFLIGIKERSKSLTLL